MKRVILIGLLISFLVVPGAGADSSGARTLATGDFTCVVSVTDPPVGTGVPSAYGAAQFSQLLGIVGGPVSSYISLGTGNGLEAVCEELAEYIHGVVRNQRCTTSVIQNVQFQGGNFMETRWSFDILCAGNQNNVVSALHTILEEVMTTPLVAQQTMMQKSDEMREINRDKK